jgi:hypothetical protein
MSVSLSVNNIDSTINIYEASEVDNITLGENNNLVNNSTVCTNINDINNNIKVLYEENTPGEVNRKIELLESVDSYALNLQTEIPK